MHAELWTSTPSERLLGRVELVDGKAVGEGEAKGIETLHVVGTDGQRVSPDDGEAFLRALPSEFRTGYTYIEIVE